MDEGKSKRNTFHRCNREDYNLWITHMYTYHCNKEMDLEAPRPQDPSVLTMQEDHRKSLLWDAQVSIFDLIHKILFWSWWLNLLFLLTSLRHWLIIYQTSRLYSMGDRPHDHSICLAREVVWLSPCRLFWSWSCHNHAIDCEMASRNTHSTHAIGWAYHHLVWCIFTYTTSHWVTFRVNYFKLAIKLVRYNSSHT